MRLITGPKRSAATPGSSQDSAPERLSTYDFGNGASYRGKGAWISGTCRGTYTLANGDKFEGAWKGGKPEGRGTYTWANGNKVTGLFHGKYTIDGPGEGTTACGDHYVGNLKNSYRHGQGTYQWKAGDRYVGQWAGGVRHGQGDQTWSDGRHYVGEWADGAMHGQGVLTVGNGYAYSGTWKLGRFVDGSGTSPYLMPPGVDGLLEAATANQQRIDGWILHPDRALLLTQPQSGPGPLHEVLTVPLNRRIAGLAQAARAGRELVAAAATETQLSLLVSTSPETQSDVVHDYVSRVFDRFPDIGTLDRGGAVKAYAQVFAEGGAGRHLIIWDNATRAHHRVLELSAAEVAQGQPQVQAPWVLAGCAGDARGYLAVLTRPRDAEAAPDPWQHAVDLLRRAAGEEAAAALDALAQDGGTVESRGALQALSRGLRAHAADPWGAYLALTAALPHLPAELGPTAVERCLSALIAWDIQARRIGAICGAMADRPAGAAASLLVAAMLRAVEAPARASSLRAAVEARSVEAVAFTLALQSPVPEREVAETAALAEATGLPALVAAARGDPQGLAQWEMLGPRARSAVLWVTERAAASSQAATPALVERLRKLVGADFEDASSVDGLRTFVRGTDVWINFEGGPKNGLLNDTTYLPDSSKRDDMERERWAGRYHDGPGAREEMPKYGWLNANKARQGLVPYGDSALVLQPHMQLRSTWVLRDDSRINNIAGTQLCMDHILLALPDDMLRGLWAASRGDRAERPHQISDGWKGFVEVQLHGPVNLQQDVRKVVAPTTALSGEGALPVSRFAQRNQLPLRWRDAGAMASADRPSYLAALGRLGLRVASWTSHGDSDRLVLHPAALEAPNGNYEIHAAPAADLLHLVSSVGRAQQEIVGLRVDRPNNKVHGPRAQATLLVRDAAAPVDYAVRRTADLDARLRQMEANGLVVCAYAQEPQRNAPLPLHILVARQSQAGEAFTHSWVAADKDRLDAARATQVAAGWTVCGLATVDGKTFTLLLRRPAEPAGLGTEGDVGGEQGEHGEDDDVTFITGEPLRTVPEALRYRDDANNAFDVDELVEFIAQRGVFKNPYTNQALSDAEAQRLLNHPSGSGARLRDMQALQSTWMRAITPTTRDQLLELVKLLETEDTDGQLVGSTQAIAAFTGLADRLDPAEQAALHSGRFPLTDTRGQPFTLSVMEALSGLQRGDGCSRATANYLKQMMEAVAAAQPSPVPQPEPAASLMSRWLRGARGRR